MHTRIFKSGNSLAIRIPREMAIVGESDEVSIERVGNTLIIQPVRGETLAGLGKVLELFSKEFMAQGRDEAPEPSRPWRTTRNTTARR